MHHGHRAPMSTIDEHPTDNERRHPSAAIWYTRWELNPRARRIGDLNCAHQDVVASALLTDLIADTGDAFFISDSVFVSQEELPSTIVTS